MRSLFIKIFLWFWLSITIVIASLALVTWLYPYSALPSGTLPDRLHELQTRGALAVYELKGQEAFDAHRKELDRASRLHTYFLDASGRELSGQTVPERLLSFAQEHADEIAEGERVMVGQPSRLAIPMTDSHGRKYLALVESDRQGFGPGFGPGARAGTQPSSRPDGFRGGSDMGRGPGSPGGGGGGGGGGRRPPDTTPRFELLVPANVLIMRLVAVILAAGLVCYLLAKYLTSPVRHLQVAARQLASGDLSARAGARLSSRRDEIGELGRDFNRMAGQVESLLTTQKRLLQDVSHELRSPLARLNVALELAGRDAGPAAAPALNRVAREAERLNQLIGQLLTLTRLEFGAIGAQKERIDLPALLSEVAADADFEAAASEKHVRIVRCDPCEVIGAPDLIRSAIENVIRNAMRYSPTGGEVEVTLIAAPQSNAEQFATLEIRDHGPGVPEDALQSIFQPFYRVSDARDRKSGGVGLGLAIADRAITWHGGTVRAANAAGGGLSVSIMLPIAPKPA